MNRTRFIILHLLSILAVVAFWALVSYDNDQKNNHDKPGENRMYLYKARDKNIYFTYENDKLISIFAICYNLNAIATCSLEYGECACITKEE